MRWPLAFEDGRFQAETAAVLVVILLRTFTGQVLVTHQYSLLVFMGIIVFAILSGKTLASNARVAVGSAKLTR